MKPTLYTLQISYDGITFTDATEFKTGVTVTATSLDTLWNYIHRYRKINTNTYYRVKGGGDMTPIYSNIISLNPASQVMGVSVLGNDNVSYCPTLASNPSIVGYDETTASFRHFKKTSPHTAGSICHFYGLKVGDKIYYSPGGGVSSSWANIYVYDTVTETFSIKSYSSIASDGAISLAYHQTSNSIWFVTNTQNQMKLIKYDIATDAFSQPLSYSSTGNYGHVVIKNDTLYVFHSRFDNRVFKYNLATNTLSSTLNMPASWNTAGEYNMQFGCQYVPSVDKVFTFGHDGVSRAFSFDLSNDTATAITVPSTFYGTIGACLTAGGNIILKRTSETFYWKFNTSTLVFTQVSDATGYEYNHLLNSGKQLRISGATSTFKVEDLGETLTVNPKDIQINK
jgi:hypothetical protein